MTYTLLLKGLAKDESMVLKTTKIERCACGSPLTEVGPKTYRCDGKKRHEWSVVKVTGVFRR